MIFQGERKIYLAIFDIFLVDCGCNIIVVSSVDVVGGIWI